METQQEKIERIKKELNFVPTLPGVYLWKDAQGEVIYVGKAKQLRARMRQYVNFQDERAKIPLLVEQIESFDYLVAQNEHEALVLEHSLINQYAPFFNADFKDDKSYPFIAITRESVFPAIKYTREKHKKDTRYFGPYTDSRAARRMVDIARKVVPLCTTSCADWRQLERRMKQDNTLSGGSRHERKGSGNNSRTQELSINAHPCFDCNVGLGPGACCGRITRGDYLKNVALIERFLSGKHAEFIRKFQQDMEDAAANLDYERAGRIWDRIQTIKSLSTNQYVVSSHSVDADIIGVFREYAVAGLTVLMVREGVVINSNEFILNKGQDVPDEDLMHNFLLKYYSTTTSIPSLVVMDFVPDDADVMGAWLSGLLDSKHGGKVRFCAPKRGEKAELLALAHTNAKHALMRYKVRSSYDDKRVNKALLQLESALALDGPPLRIECFDISTIHGSYTVASMVVFTNGKPDKKQYRRFRVKTPLDESNDILCMTEVLKRRYDPKQMHNERFGSKPDLLILDGGKPQLSAARKVFDNLGINTIALCGLAKRDEELFVPWQQEGPVVLPSGSESLYVVKQIRDEAHRFAITYHRQLRGKGMTKSILDEVVGLGPVRKKALLKHFGSFKKLCNANLSDILESNVLPHAVAEEAYKVLAQYKKDANVQ